MDKKIILGSLAMDLKRTALGYHRGSLSMANKFLNEAIERRKEYKINDLKPYLLRILNSIKDLKKQPNDKLAENALMYSTLIQNYIFHN